MRGVLSRKFIQLRKRDSLLFPFPPCVCKLWAPTRCVYLVELERCLTCFNSCGCLLCRCCSTRQRQSSNCSTWWLTKTRSPASMLRTPCHTDSSSTSIRWRCAHLRVHEFLIHCTVRLQCNLSHGSSQSAFFLPSRSRPSSPVLFTNTRALF